jgi:CheY-like chemotaxis protein
MPACAEGPILIVDDHANAREALRELLEIAGSTVVTAEDGAVALRRLRDGLAPCLILLDLMMPNKDGFTFHRECRADPDLAMIPIVVYSGIHNVHYAALEMGVVGYFQQPVQIDTLRELVARYRFP